MSPFVCADAMVRMEVSECEGFFPMGSRSWFWPHFLSSAARRRHARRASSARYIGFDFGGDSGCPNVTNCENKKLNAGVAFGAMGPVLGFEEELGYAKIFLEQHLISTRTSSLL